MGTGVSPKRIDTKKLVSFRTVLCTIQTFATLCFAHVFYRPICFRSFVPLNASIQELFRSISSPQYLNSISNPYFFLRKEVIQPHLPIRLPCYDFTPVIRPAFGSSLPPAMYELPLPSGIVSFFDVSIFDAYPRLFIHTRGLSH